MNRAHLPRAEWHNPAPDAHAAGLLALPADLRRSALLLVLRHWLATTLQHPNDDIADTVPLTALGLDAPAAADLAATLARQLRVAVPAAELAGGLSLAGLVNLLLDMLPGPAAQQRGGPARRVEPLVFEPERHGPAGGAVSNMPLALRLRGPLQAGPLAESLNALVRRHAALCAARPTEGAAGVCVPLRLVDLRPAAAASRELAWHALADADLQQPFDLPFGPLFRAMLVRLDEQEHVLLVTLHHSAADRCPPERLAQELARLYAAGQRGAPARRDAVVG